MWAIWKTYYMTYAEVAEQGDKPHELVARGLPWADAVAMIERMGFGYSIHPA